jgi:hypothetical protein
VSQFEEPHRDSSAYRGGNESEKHAAACRLEYGADNQVANEWTRYTQHDFDDDEITGAQRAAREPSGIPVDTPGQWVEPLRALEATAPTGLARRWPGNYRR